MKAYTVEFTQKTKAFYKVNAENKREAIKKAAELMKTRYSLKHYTTEAKEVKP